MFDSLVLTQNELIAFTAGLLGTSSPGPSNMAVMSTAMNSGRRPALALAAGVTSGSLFWGVMALVGLSAVIASHVYALSVLKVIAGGYLLWLGAKAARACVFPRPSDLVIRPTPPRYRDVYLRGVLMHLTNPKAVLVWMSIMSLGLPAAPTAIDGLRLLTGSTLIAGTVFASYAIAFSTARARTAYLRHRRKLEGTFAGFFGYAGVRLIVTNLRPG